MQPSPIQNLVKQGIVIGETITDINKIRAEKEPSNFCKKFTNVKRVGPELPPTDNNTKDIKTLHIQFVTNLY